MKNKQTQRRRGCEKIRIRRISMRFFRRFQITTPSHNVPRAVLGWGRILKDAKKLAKGARISIFSQPRKDAKKKQNAFLCVTAPLHLIIFLFLSSCSAPTPTPLYPKQEIQGREHNGKRFN